MNVPIVFFTMAFSLLKKERNAITYTFTLPVFGIDNRISFTGVSLEMSRSHSSLQLCLDTVCMNMRRESSPCYTPETTATVTKVKSKMATSIKLKVLRREFINQIFINQPRLFNLGGEQSIWIAPTNAEHKTDGSGSGGKLTGSKHFRWHAANFSIAVSYQNT